MSLKRSLKKIADTIGNGKDEQEIQNMYKQALIEFINDSKKEVQILVTSRSETIGRLANLPGLPIRDSKRKKCTKKIREHIQEIDSLMERKRSVVLFWEEMTQKFGVTLDQLEHPSLVLERGTTFRDLFPDLF